jgi:hypothetical protein
MKMTPPRTFTLGCLAAICLSLAPAVSAELSIDKLKGEWKCYVDYETHTLRFMTSDRLEFDGEVQFYTLKEDAVEVDYERYPCRFDGDTLVVTADGREVRFTRVVPDPPAAAVEARNLLGYWKSQTDWGIQYLSVVSDTELEAGGECLTYSLMPHAVRVNGSDYPYVYDGDRLTVTIPEEGRQVTFTRDPSVFLGAWVAEVDGMTIPLVVLSEDTLEYDYQYTAYELVPGAVRVEGMDYPYRFEGPHLVAEIDGREVRFQRDASQLLGTWEGEAEGRDVSISFLSEKQVRAEGEVNAYTLMPGTIRVDGKCVPYRFRKGRLVLAIPEKGEVVLKKTKKAAPAWQALQGVWEARGDWETHRLNIMSAGQLSYNGEVYDYTLLDGAVRVDYENYPFRLEGDALIVTLEGVEQRFTRTTP